MRFTRHEGAEVCYRYPEVVKARFEAQELDGGAKTSFRIWLGSDGPLRGVPLRIEYQPNWWFRIILHLDREHPEKTT